MKNTKKIVFSLLIILSLVFSTSEFLPAPQNTATVEAATKARLNKTKATLIKGQTLNLKMSGAKSSVKWSSSKSGIATVNAKGKVTARKNGNRCYHRQSRQAKIYLQNYGTDPIHQQKVCHPDRRQQYHLEN